MVADRLINNIFYQFWRLTKVPVVPDDDRNRLSPLFAGGMFRSGTSLLTSLLRSQGFDVGPEHHLLKGVGRRKDLNPEGFLENYLFMEWSVMYMKLHGLNGASLTSPGRWMSISETKIQREAFVKFCLLENCDDRIRNRYKLEVLKKYDPTAMDNYLRENFGKFPLVKNPHFSLFFPALFEYWPNARLLLSFQDPQNTLRSVNEKMLPVDPLLYSRYYKAALDSDDPRIAFFDLGGFFSDPRGTLNALSEFTGRPIIAEHADIQRKSNSGETNNALRLPDDVLETFSRLKKKCINPAR